MKVEQPPITAWKGCLVVKTDVLTLDGNATMETYLLDQPYGPALLPMAVICPGSRYLDCSPTEGECVALRFNNRNCHAAVLHYATAKSAPGHSHFPRPLEDLAEAICLIRRNARDWGVDPDRIVIVGFSAGAHLCALYSSYWNRKLLQAKGSPRQLRPNAVILGYPLADEFMNRSDMQKKLQQEIDMERITGEKKRRHRLQDFWQIAETAEFGCSDPTDEAMARQSPVEQVNADTAPTFVWTTFGDKLISPIQSLRYAEALYRAGVSCELHVYQNGDHGLSLADASSARKPEEILPHVGTWCSLALEWLEELFDAQKKEEEVTDAGI